MQASYDDLSVPIESLLSDLKLPRDEIIIKELKNILISSIPTQIAYPDTMDSLARLKKNYKLILLTNSFSQGYAGLNRKFCTDETFSHVITSFESHRIKPDIQLFKDAISSTNCKLSEIVMVGDSLHDDIEPAQSLSLEAILLDRKGRYPDAKNRVATLRKLEDIVGSF